MTNMPRISKLLFTFTVNMFHPTLICPASCHSISASKETEDLFKSKTLAIQPAQTPIKRMKMSYKIWSRSDINRRQATNYRYSL